MKDGLTASACIVTGRFGNSHPFSMHQLAGEGSAKRLPHFQAKDGTPTTQPSWEESTQHFPGTAFSVGVSSISQVGISLSDHYLGNSHYCLLLSHHFRKPNIDRKQKDGTRDKKGATLIIHMHLHMLVSFLFSLAQTESSPKQASPGLSLRCI